MNMFTAISSSRRFLFARPRVFCVSATSLAILLFLALPSFSQSKSAPRISAENLKKHIAKLSSDEFEGRAPGTKGEQLSVKYIEDQFRAVGLEAGNPDGTFRQKVPLAGITANQDMKLTLTGKGKTFVSKFGPEFVA